MLDCLKVKGIPCVNTFRGLGIDPQSKVPEVRWHDFLSYQRVGSFLEFRSSLSSEAGTRFEVLRNNNDPPAGSPNSLGAFLQPDPMSGMPATAPASNPAMRCSRFALTEYGVVMVSRRRVVQLDVAGRFAFVLRGTRPAGTTAEAGLAAARPRVPRRLPALRRSLPRRLRRLAAVQCASVVFASSLTLSWNNPGSRARGQLSTGGGEPYG